MPKRTMIALFLLLPLSVCAADWPQFRGPDRGGISPEKGLLQAWPKGGPELLWTYSNAGLGFSSPSIVGDRLYTMGVRNDKTYVFALDISGKEPKEVWAYEVGPLFTYQGNQWGDGPRNAPTVDGDLVFALSGRGDLVCLKTASGELVWRKSLPKDLGGKVMKDWGYCEAVLVDGDKVICTPGGREGTFAALDKKTGNVLWRTKDLTDMATYASVVVAEIDGVRQYVGTSFMGPEGGNLVGIAAEDGSVLWKEHFTKSDVYTMIFTPVVKGNQVYICEGDGGFCHLFTVRKQGNTFALKDSYNRRVAKNMKNNHGGVVLINGHVYGYSDRAGWVCQEWKTGKNAWEEPNQLPCNASGAIAAADGHLYLFTDLGEVALVKATPEGWQEKGRFTIPKTSELAKDRPTSQSAEVWTHPVIANGRLYLRDQEFIFCYDIQGNKK